MLYQIHVSEKNRIYVHLLKFNFHFSFLESFNFLFKNDHKILSLL
ncbi:hypothetical protein LMANV2_280056 [Leptospira interrogans serovar Manilae]|uniref:Uncharacterized protein n=1 Tax=Leptospira interrogans serovar Manilae TaxID=214675 RepID=A0AAQ1NXH5_LEPIR|nr:hypothetical protein LMANV2_280056 [Leptospira interrogans serovar Manilae]